MINHNLALYKLLDRTLSVDAFGGNWVANFTEGDLFELNKKLNDSLTKYPIIWLQSGYKVQRNLVTGTSTLVGCKFFFITMGSKHDRYLKRYDTVYSDMLYPLIVAAEKLISKTNGMRLASESSLTALPFNDTSELARADFATKGQRATVGEIWDAVLYEADLTIDECVFDSSLIIDPKRVSTIN